VRALVRGISSALNFGVDEKSRSRLRAVRDIRDGVSSLSPRPGEERTRGVLRGDDPIVVLMGDLERGGGSIGLSLLRRDFWDLTTSVGSGMVPR
jgi:hypothetical protein